MDVNSIKQLTGRGTSKKPNQVNNISAESFKSLFNASKEKVRTSDSKTQDSMSISQTALVAQKMDKLKQMHEETDYSGMSDEQIFKTIYERYNQEIPHLSAKAALNHVVYEPLMRQMNSQMRETFEDSQALFTTGNQLHVRAMGYEGMSKAEILDKINRESPDDGSLLMKVEIFQRMEATELIAMDSPISIEFHSAMNSMIHESYHKQTGIRDFNYGSESYINWMKNGNNLAESKMSWSDIKNKIYERGDIEKTYGIGTKELFDDFFEIMEEAGERA